MIFISQTHLHEMIAFAETAYPEECCGLLTGVYLRHHVCRIARVIQSQNVHPSGAYDRFEIDPRVRFALMRELGEIGDFPPGPERLIGHYHSHPEHSVAPSEHDLACAFEPNLFWIILSLSKGKVNQIGAYKLDQTSTKFLHVPLRQPNGTAYVISPDYS